MMCCGQSSILSWSLKSVSSCSIKKRHRGFDKGLCSFFFFFFLLLLILIGYIVRRTIWCWCFCSFLVVSLSCSWSPGVIYERITLIFTFHTYYYYTDWITPLYICIISSFNVMIRNNLVYSIIIGIDTIPTHTSINDVIILIDATIVLI